MGFLEELRSSLENPQVPLSFPAEWLTDIYNGGRTDSGLRVSQLTALQVPAVLACVTIVSSAIAALPLNAVEVTQNDQGRVTRRLAYDHELQDLLHDRPHPEYSSRTWRLVMQVHALLWGNAYSEILYDNAERIAALAVRKPWMTHPMRLRQDTAIDGEIYKKGTLVYKTTQGVSDEDVITDGEIRSGDRLIAPENMIFIPGLTLDGRLGQDTIWLTRQCIGLALATEKFGAKFFGNGGHPGGVLELLGGSGNSAGITQDQLDKARNSFQEATGGENMHRIFVVKGGTKFTPLATPNDTAQYLETRKFQNQQIAAIFQVPLHMLGEPGTNRATAEQLGQEFVNYTLGPWIPAWEQELKYKLFTLPNQRGRNAGRYEPKLDTRNLVYPDSTSKSNFYQKGKQSGWLNTNMILELEGMNPISEEAGGEDFWQPVNMVVIGQPAPTPKGTESEPEEPGENEPEKPGEQEPEQKSAPDFSTQISTVLPLFSDAFGRYSKRQKPELADFEAIFRPILTGLRDGIRNVAAKDIGVSAPQAMPETDKFISGYLASAYKRAADLQPENALSEAQRAVRALAVEVYKELAVKKVK